MKKNIPDWALKTATPKDHVLAREAHKQGNMLIKWPDSKAVRDWARKQGWSTPFFGFEETFITKMFETPENFELALQYSDIGLRIPRQDYTITPEKLRELDEFYEKRSELGHPNCWGILVEELREIRRAVESGVAVRIEGEQAMLSRHNFYDWAHGRYHMLEDGYDKWIGDDS